MSPYLKVAIVIIILFFISSEVVGFTPYKKFYYINELNREDFNFGTFVTEGYVVDKYSCPKCKDYALCDPCRKDYIIISEEKNKYYKDNITNKELLIFVDNADDFIKNRKYEFLIKILDVKTTKQALNNIKLIHYQKSRRRRRAR